MEEQTIEILRKIKEDGLSFCVLRDENALGECLYEEYIFYIPEKDYFIVQTIDWEKFLLKGIVGSSTFNIEKERDVIPLIQTKLEVM